MCALRQFLGPRFRARMKTTKQRKADHEQGHTRNDGKYRAYDTRNHQQQTGEGIHIALPAGSTRQETSAAVSTPGALMPMLSVTMRGLFCRPFSTHMKKATEIASAAMRGSTTPKSSCATAVESNMGACAVGTSSKVEM